jgi:hypothetical protein
MSADVFARLAARALGAVPLARPAIAPLYAPQAALPGAVAADDAILALSVEDSGTEPSLVQPRRREPPFDVREPIAMPAAERPRDAANDQRRFEQAAAQRPASPSLAPAPGPLDRVAAVSAEPGQCVAEQPIPSPGPALATSEDRAIAYPPSPQPVRSKPEPEPERRRPLRESTGLLNSGRLPSVAPVVHLPRPRPLPITAPRREASEPVSLPPLIRVSIGRVDVRAVQAPATSTATRTPATSCAPALSLDDYLRERNEGRR